jgi:hypothetical protein
VRFLWFDHSRGCVWLAGIGRKEGWECVYI